MHLPSAPHLTSNEKNWLYFFGGVATVVFLVKVTRPEVAHVVQKIPRSAHKKSPG